MRWRHTFLFKDYFQSNKATYSFNSQQLHTLSLLCFHFLHITLDKLFLPHTNTYIHFPVMWMLSDKLLLQNLLLVLWIQRGCSLILLVTHSFPIFSNNFIGSLFSLVCKVLSLCAATTGTQTPMHTTLIINAKDPWPEKTFHGSSLTMESRCLNLSIAEPLVSCGH